MVDTTNAPASSRRVVGRRRRVRHTAAPARRSLAVAVLTAMVVLVATVSPSASALGPVLRSTEIDLGDVLAAASGRPAGGQPPTDTTPAGDEIEPVVLIPGFHSDGSVHRYRMDGSSDGVLAPDGDVLRRARAVAVGGDGLVYVADADGDQVLRFDPVDSSLIDVFVSPRSNGLSDPRGLAFGPDGNLVVASAGSGQLLEYDGRTGQSLGVVADGLNNPGGLAFSDDGHLITTGQNDDSVLIFVDGVLRSSGEVGPGAGPVDVAVDDEGTLFVALVDAGRIDRIDLNRLDRTDPEAVLEAEPFVTTGLASPSSLAIGPDGKLWVTDQWTDQVHRFDRDTGQLVDTIIDSDAPVGPSDLVFYPDGSTGPDRAPGNGTPAGRGAGLSAADWLAQQAPGGRDRGGLRFEANDGRAAPELDFVAYGRGYGVVLAGGDAIVSPDGTEDNAIRMDFVGAADDPAPRSLRSEAAPSVVYNEVYPGIDVTYRDNRGDLEYLLTIEPGADPDAVSFDLSNAADVDLTPGGSLLIWVPSGGAMELTAPVAYQERDGSRLDIESRFEQRSDGTIGFEVGSYDPGLPVVIDPTFRASTSADSGGGNTITIARPAGVTTDDLLLASIAQPASASVTPPAGWTLIRSDARNDSVRQDLFYKVASGSEPASYVFNLGAVEFSAGAIVVYDGVDTSNPIDAHGGQGNGESSSYTAPSITTTTSGAMLVAFFANTAGSAITPPAGMTERADQTSVDGATGIADEILGAAGSTGTRTATGSSGSNVGQLVALTPAPVVTHSVSGKVFEDIAGDVLSDGSIGDVNNPAVDGVDVDLWRDELGPVALDAAGNSGMYTSIQIGSDGFPVISYVRDSKVTVLHCEDASCSSSTTQVVDNTVNAAYTSMAIGADGNPIISYYDATNADLRVAHCDDPACTTATVSTVDSAGTTGAYNSITISDAGLAIIAFADLTDRTIRVAYCSNVACTSSTLRTIETVGGTSNAGVSIAIGTDGNPILSYFDSGFSSREIRAAHCNDAACTSVTVSVIDDTVENGSGWTDLAIGSDGLPIISYHHNQSIGGSRLRVAKCLDIACTTSSYTTIEEANAGTHNAIDIGPDGLPVIAFNGWINTDLRVARCTDLSCSTFIVGSVDAPGQNGEYVSITHGVDGRPLISYRKTTGQELKLAGPDGDGVPSGGDALVATTTTGGGGAYGFGGLEADTYFVTVDSTSVAPSGGLNGGATQGDVWAEQTWGPTGAVCADGAGGEASRVGAGPCFGGRRGGVSDAVAAIDTAEHVAAATVGPGDATGVDFGFSFNTTTTVNGGDTSDDDAGANRTVQGSLRQFIQNGNAITGTNAMRFVPAVPTNAVAGADIWWRLAVTNALPSITDAATTIDGTAFDLADGVTVRDTNSLGPELELDGTGTGSTIDGLAVTGGGSTVRDLVIGNFGRAGIRLTTAGGSTIAGNYLGLDATGSTSAGNNDGIQIVSVANNLVGGTSLADRNVISGNDDYGIEITGAGADSSTVEGNYIGTDASGTVDRGNATDGVAIRSGAQSNEIGGLTTAERNVIAGNNNDGIWITGTGTDNNTVHGNWIGFGSDSSPIPNSYHGIGVENGAGNNLIGGDVTAAANRIGNSTWDGVAIANGTGTGNSVLGNSIVGNAGLGIDIDNDGITANDADDIDGGPNGRLNFPEITGASEAGGTVTVDFDLDVPAGDYRIEAFTNPSGADPSGNGEGETYEAATTVTHTGSGAESFQVAYSGAAGDEVTLTATEEAVGPVYGSTSELSAAMTVTPAGVVVNSTGDASDATPGDDVCHTGGTNSEGDPACTLRAAIEEANASATIDTINFAIPATDAGHSGGVWTISPGTAYAPISAATTMDGTTQPGWVADPIIEVDGVSTTSATGLTLSGTSDGSTVTGLRIIDFDVDGVFIASGADAITISKSWIGSDGSGSSVPGNGDDGIDVRGTNAIIDGNVVNHNSDEGIDVRAAGATIIGTIVGLESDASSGSGNGDVGIAIFSDNATVGGPMVAERNIISLNVEGIEINSNNNIVQGNYIGTDATGVANRGNDSDDGVEIQSGSGNLIGGTAAGEANLIAYNQLDGVNITGGTGHSVLGNRIHSNGQRGIDLGPGGITANDVGDGDSGANDLLNYPEITAASEAGGTVTVDFDLDVPAGDYRIEAFTNPSGADPSGNGEGEIYEAATTITHTGSGAESFQVVYSGAAGDEVTLTATEEAVGPVYGSTSEFSTAVTVTGAGASVNSTGDASDATPGDDVCDTGGTNSEGDPECTLRAAIEEANASATVDTIDFAIPTSDGGYSASPLSYTMTPGSPYPLITSPVTIDATTQPGWAGDPIVQLDGTGAVGATAGLAIRANDCTIAGFIVHSFPDEGLEIDGSTGFGDGNVLRNNRVGLDAAGSVVGNTDDGILVSVDAIGNLVGGTGANDGNLVAGSGGAGINVRTNSFDNTLLGNEVWANTGLGIDLDDDGLTANDGGDGDSGSNDLLNFPAITSLSESAGTVTATFDLDVPANPDQYRVEFYRNPSGADPSGYGEGEIFVSSVVTGPGLGLTHNFAGSVGDVITATVTKIDSGAVTGFGPTSEFSEAAIVPNPALTAVSFQQGVDGYSGTVDTWISSNVPNQDNSADVLIQVDNSPLQHGLIRFDGIIGAGPGQIPSGATIISAELTFEATDPSAADASLSFHRVLRSWIETDTWNSLSSGISTDDVEASSATDAVHTGGLDLTGTPITITGLEAAVQAWADGNSNRGWLFTLDRDDGWDARSSENSVVAGRPKLDVTYVVGPVTFVVNSTGDAADTSPGDYVCDTGGTNSAGDPECTLRAAIQEANAVPTVDVIEFAMPATEAGHTGGIWTISPGSPLASLSDAVTIDGSSQTGWTTTPVVELNGASAGGSTDGLRITADDVTIRSLAINRFGADGIEVASGAANATIVGNHLGLDAGGMIDRGNGARGIDLGTGSGPTTVGGTAAADRNVISRNGIDGIVIWNSDANTVIGNYIGTDVTGNAPEPNTQDGIKLGGTSSNNVIGQPGAGNVLSGNGHDGIELDDGLTGNVIQANIIGLGADGSTLVDNARYGVVLYNGVNNTQIGGVGAGEGNVISNNTSHGIMLDGNANPATANNTIEGNLIGTDATGLLDRGNGGAGIFFYNGANTTTIGGTGAGAGNTIAHNGGDGVNLQDASADLNPILGNSIFANSQLGIDLDNNDVTLNDGGDGDSGANDLLNFPVLTTPVSGDTTVAIDLDVPAGDYRVEVFVNPTEGADPTGFGEGETWLAAQAVTHTGSGSEPFVVAIPAVFAGEVLTATATEDLGGGSFGATSEFSAAVTVVAAVETVPDASLRRSDVSAEGGLDPASAATAGTAGSALSFDGGDDLLRGPGLDVTESALTVSAWIHRAGFTGTDYVVSKRTSGGDPVYELGVDGSGQAVARLRIGGGPVVVQGGAVTAGSWHHVAVSWDGAIVRLYVDGSEVDSAAAAGSLFTDVATDMIIGNRSDGSAGFDGEIDHVEIAHAALTAAEVTMRYSTVADQALTVHAGQQQTAAPGPWTLSGVQTRSGGFALAAPETADSGAAAWVVATGIDEPGTVFETWWWTSIATGVDLGSGTRAGVSPTDQFDAAYTGADTWNLRQRSGAVASVDGSGTQALGVGSWVKVEQWTDQNGNSRLLVDGVEVAPWVAQSAPPASGSLGLRVGELPNGQSWYVDDPRARRLVMPEPTSTLGSLDRD